MVLNDIIRVHISGWIHTISNQLMSGQTLFKTKQGARCSSVVRVFAHGVMGCRIDLSWGGPIELFLDWCNKGCGMCYPVCGMVHIKEPLLLIGKSSPCSGSGFPLSLSKWSFTICPTPYNHKIKCVECVVK